MSLLALSNDTKILTIKKLTWKDIFSMSCTCQKFNILISSEDVCENIVRSLLGTNKKDYLTFRELLLHCAIGKRVKIIYFPSSDEEEKSWAVLYPQTTMIELLSHLKIENTIRHILLCMRLDLQPLTILVTETMINKSIINIRDNFNAYDGVFCVVIRTQSE